MSSSTPSNNLSRRGFLGTAAATMAAAHHASSAEAAPSGLNLNAMLQPVPKTACLIDDDWYIWGGSMVRTEDGVCHLLFARWPRKLGHYAWLSHSEVGYATADTPLGPYTVQGQALPGNNGPNWVTSTVHNPTIHRFGDRYYLYFSSARVVGELNPGQPKARTDWWEPTRRTQRVGVAVASHPSGPWERVDEPLMEATPGSYDAHMTSNPSIAQAPDGAYVMVYKCQGADEKVFHGVAVSESPLGPFKKDPKPILTHETLKFPAEDPYIWYGPDRFYGILKDFRGTYTGHKNSLALFESADGHAWALSQHPLVATRTITYADGTQEELLHLERPQLWLDNGKPAVLFCAADRDKDRSHSFNIHLPLGGGRGL